MQRDMELVRKIALFFEQTNSTWVDNSHSGLRKHDGRLVRGMLPDIEGYSDEELRHALAVMVDSGLIVEDAEFSANRSTPAVVLGRRLGWSGHELLDALRDEEAFTRVTDAANRAKNWTIQFMLEAAKRFAFQQIGL